jgi:GDSL-like lipase/acylhydrolase family protein
VRATRRPGGGHLVLLGDSIFDNAAYVGDGPRVIDQVRERIPSFFTATLLAIDGSRASDIEHQLARAPASATHVIVSAGGNDALQHAGMLNEPARSVREVVLRLAEVRERFRRDYERMLDVLLTRRLPSGVCTIYEPRFADGDLQRCALAVLSMFNDVILRSASSARIPVIDLRVVFGDASDYANQLEPSVVGGRKIAALIGDTLARHELSRPSAVRFA